MRVNPTTITLCTNERTIIREALADYAKKQRNRALKVIRGDTQEQAEWREAMAIDLLNRPEIKTR